MPDRNEELTNFKMQINLAELAASYGYMRDKVRSTSHSISMKNEGGGVIVISKNTNNHWQYFSPDNQNHKGTVIDFVQNIENVNLGEARKILRRWTGESQRRDKIKDWQNISVSKKDVVSVRKYLGRFKPAKQSDYLESRKITRQTLNQPCFRGKILSGYKGGVIFPHWDESGLCGYEVKAEGFTTFSKDGFKSLWTSNIPSEPKMIIVVESGVEALSYHQLHQPERVLYIATSGNWSETTSDRMRKVFEKLNVSVVGAFNNDKGGVHHIERLEKVANDAGVLFKSELPKIEGADWNSTLINVLQKQNTNN